MKQLKNLRQGYQGFFIKNEAGRYFTEVLDEIIQAQYKQAEDNPETARDSIQRARDVREVISHIQSVCAEGGKKTK